jgi:hypothetical protein
MVLAQGQDTTTSATLATEQAECRGTAGSRLQDREPELQDTASSPRPPPPAEAGRLHDTVLHQPEAGNTQSPAPPVQAPAAGPQMSATQCHQHNILECKAQPTAAGPEPDAGLTTVEVEQQNAAPSLTSLDEGPSEQPDLSMPIHPVTGSHAVGSAAPLHSTLTGGLLSQRPGGCPASGAREPGDVHQANPMAPQKPVVQGALQEVIVPDQSKLPEAAVSSAGKSQRPPVPVPVAGAKKATRIKVRQL